MPETTETTMREALTPSIRISQSLYGVEQPQRQPPSLRASHEEIHQLHKDASLATTMITL
jgi:hypothetical protein